MPKSHAYDQTILNVVFLFLLFFKLYLQKRRLASDRYVASILFFVLVILDLIDAKTLDVPYSCIGEAHAKEKINIISNEPLQGFLVSSNYPNHYPPDQQCTFGLSAPLDSGLVLHFAFIDLDLEERFSKSTQCLRDYIRFMVTDREGREHIGPRICGGSSLPSAIRGMQSKVDILFISSFAAAKHRGFKIRFEFVPEVKIGAPPSIYADPNTGWQRDCGGTVDVQAPSSEIRSPGFPSTYPRDVTCNWLIRVEPHERIYLRLIHLELSPTIAECERASLLIVDGYRYNNGDTPPTRRYSENLGIGPDVRYCGGHLYYNEEGSKSYLSTSNRVIIKFVSRDQPTPEQFASYHTKGIPIGFRILWTKVVNSMIVDTVEVDSEAINADNISPLSIESACKGGFLCKGGEFCIDDGHNVCAQRSRLCINSSLQCNGVANCAENDDSDEYHCYSRDKVALACLALFAVVLMSTLFLLTVRSLIRCKERRQCLKNTRELYTEKMKKPGNKNSSTISTKTKLETARHELSEKNLAVSSITMPQRSNNSKSEKTKPSRIKLEKEPVNKEKKREPIKNEKNIPAEKNRIPSTLRGSERESERKKSTLIASEKHENQPKFETVILAADYERENNARHRTQYDEKNNEASEQDLPACNCADSDTLSRVIGADIVVHRAELILNGDIDLQRLNSFELQKPRSLHLTEQQKICETIINTENKADSIWKESIRYNSKRRDIKAKFKEKTNESPPKTISSAPTEIVKPATVCEAPIWQLAPTALIRQYSEGTVLQQHQQHQHHCHGYHYHHHFPSIPNFDKDNSPLPPYLRVHSYEMRGDGDIALNFIGVNNSTKSTEIVDHEEKEKLSNQDDSNNLQTIIMSALL